MRKIICFDLEGPLSSQDHAYQVMKLIPEGEKIFEVISRYDDLLTLEGREDYEPGDTLKLISPFLISHKICEKDLTAVSDQANLVEGSQTLIDLLKREGWKIYIISASYEQHALRIAKRMNILPNDVFCTRFPLNQFHERLIYGKRDFKWIEPIFEVKEKILRKLWIEDLNSGEKDEEIKSTLDEFFWKKLAETVLWPIFNPIQVMGGKRKIEALNEIIKKHRTSLKEIAVVGDSITDFKMLETVNKAKGLAIVFNGNEYVLPYGTVGVNGYDLRLLLFVLEAWKMGGRKEVKQKISDDSTQTYHWLKRVSKKKYQTLLELHKRARKIVRGSQEAKLS